MNAVTDTITAFVVCDIIDVRQILLEVSLVYEPLRTTQGMRQYLDMLLQQDTLQTFLKTNSIESVSLPEIVIKETCGARLGALTYGHSLITMSSWILENTNSTAATLRHEFAHVIKSKGRFKGSPHGAFWLQCLQAVSPVTWETDKYWTPTEEIEKKRLSIHPTAKRLLLLDKERIDDR